MMEPCRQTAEQQTESPDARGTPPPEAGVRVAPKSNNSSAAGVARFGKPKQLDGQAVLFCKEMEVKLKTYNVTFWNMAGESLGTVAAQATTPNKAGWAALQIYTPFKYVRFTAEAA